MSNGTMIGIAVGQSPVVILMLLFGRHELAFGYVAGVSSVILGGVIHRVLFNQSN